MLDPLHASTLLFFTTADSYSVPLLYQNHLISSTLNRSIKHTHTVLTNCWVISFPGQIQFFCSLVLGFFKLEISIFFSYFSPVLTLSDYFPVFSTKMTVMDQQNKNGKIRIKTLSHLIFHQDKQNYISVYLDNKLIHPIFNDTAPMK